MAANDLYPPAVVEAIRRDPDDDDPRLAFADWLAGRGEPLAEFIRLQCRNHRSRPLLPLREHVQRWQAWEFFANGRGSLGDEVARLTETQVAYITGTYGPSVAMSEEERSFLADHEPSWVGPLGGAFNHWPDRRLYRRGFIEHLELTAEEWLGLAPEVLEWCPALRSLTVNEIPGHLPALASCRRLARIEEVHLDTRSVNLREGWRWHQFHVYGWIESEADQAALCGWPNRSQALFLRIGDVETDDVLRRLASSPVLSNLARLDLMWTERGIVSYTDEDMREREREMGRILGKEIGHVLDWDQG